MITDEQIIDEAADVSPPPALDPAHIASAAEFEAWLDTPGPRARPMQMDWARSLRDQCQAAEVPFFFKQAVVDGKLVKMPALDGLVWDEIPE